MKKEIKKSLKNKYFILACTYGIIIAILHCCQRIPEYNDMISEFIQSSSSSDIKYNPHAPITNAFTLWIGCDSESKYTKIFYFLFPIVATLPYCWSYCSDLKNGYADKAIREFGKFKYHLYKYISVFVSSGLTMTIPLLFDFLIILFFVPSIFPDSIYDIYYGIFSNNFMADTFYGQPFLYVLTFIILGFIFCGLFGCLGYTVSTIIKSRIVSIVIPSAILFLIEYIKNIIVKNNPINNTEFSPLSFLCPFKSYTTNWIVIISEIAVIFLITFYLSVIKYKIFDCKKDNNISCTDSF